MSLLLIPVFAAVVFPPTITKSFSPPLVLVNQTSVLTITIGNPNDTALTGASMNDVLNPPLVTTGAGSTTCGGFLLVSPNLIILNGATIPANGSCTVTTMAFAPQPGVFQNVTGAVFSVGPASLQRGVATLTVVTDIPALPRWALAMLALILAGVGWVTSSARR